MINGRLTDCDLALVPGGRLAKPYALRWNMMCGACRAAGTVPPMPNGPDSTYRRFARQVYWKAYWTARGLPGNAATPGTSNHGLGRAVDTDGQAKAYKYGSRFGVRPPSDAPWEGWHTLIHLDSLGPVVKIEPVIRKGTLNRLAISYLQRMLAKDSIRVKVTGKYDLQTRRAVRRFQKVHKLTVDGVVGPKVWAALHKAIG